MCGRILNSEKAAKKWTAMMINGLAEIVITKKDDKK